MNALHQFQQAIIPEVLRSLRPDNPTLLVAPTGAGKTVMAAEIALHFNTVLWVAHRIELIDQATAENGFNVQVMSVLAALRHGPPKIDLLIIDEAHRGMAKTYRNLIQKYKDCCVLGLTATALRTDGQGLIDVFDEIVQCSSVKELVASRHLVPYLAFEAPDEALQVLDSMKRNRGDYDQGKLSALMSAPRLVGNVVREYQRHCIGRKAIVFAVSLKHSRMLAAAFIESGIRAAHLDGTASPAMRRSRLADLKEGRIEVLCNVNLFTEGWDCPPVSCVIMARPTRSLTLYLQSVGRGMRTDPGKSDLIILDHAGNISRHGYPDEDRVWTLESEAQRIKREAEIVELDRIYSLGFDSLEQYELEQRRVMDNTYPSTDKVFDRFREKAENGAFSAYLRLHGISPVVPKSGKRMARYRKSDIDKLTSLLDSSYSASDVCRVLGVNPFGLMVLCHAEQIQPCFGRGSATRYSKLVIDNLLVRMIAFREGSLSPRECITLLQVRPKKLALILRRNGITGSLPPGPRSFKSIRYPKAQVQRLAEKLKAGVVNP